MKLKYFNLAVPLGLCVFPIVLQAQLISGVQSIPSGAGELMVATPYDNGYALAGFVNNHISVIKFNAATWVEWSEFVGSNADSSDMPNNIICTSDSGLAIIGSANVYGASQYDIRVMKLNKKGSLEWGRMIGTSYEDFGEAIIQTKDSGYVVGGITHYASVSGLDIIKLNSAGELLWSKSYVTYHNSLYSALAATTDGGFISVNEDTNVGNDVIRVLKFDSAGNLKWSKAISGGWPNSDIFITALNNGNFAIVCNYERVFMGYQDVIINIIDSSAKVLHSFLVESGWGVCAYGISPAYYGGMAFSGFFSGCFECSQDMIAMAFDSAANTVMNVSLGSTSTYDGNYIGEAIVANNDSSFNITVEAAGGSISGPDAFMKLDKKGNSCITNGGVVSASGYADSTMNISVTPIGALTIDSADGSVLGPEYVPDSVLCEVLGVQPVPVAEDKVDVYPNPTTGAVNIFQSHFVPNEKIEIYSTLGQLVYSTKLTGNVTTLNLNAVSGLYLYIIRSKEGSIISEGKIVEL